MQFQFILKQFKKFIKISLYFVILVFLFKNSYAISNIEISGSSKESLPLELKIADFNHVGNLSLLHMIIDRVKLQLNDSLIFKVHREEENNNFISMLLKKPTFLANFHVIFSISTNSDNEIIISVEIFDKLLRKTLDEFSISVNYKSWYVSAAKISDKIFYYFTGVDGYFDSSIIFVTEKGKFNNRKKRIAIMSLYGDEYKEVTNDEHLVLSPTISKDQNLIAYVSYKTQKPKTYIHNLKTKKSNVAIPSNKDFMTLTPNFIDYNNNELLLSKVINGNSEIIKYNIANNKTTVLTRNIATDISPNYSDKLDKIIFSSDRSGKPELYMMNKDGSNVKRIKFRQGSYTNPKFSPDGRYIAFTRILNNEFSIGILDTENFVTKILATSYKNDAPSWAPNSKYIMFTKMNYNKKSKKRNLANLFIVDLNGNIINKVKTPYDASEAYWFKN